MSDTGKLVRSHDGRDPGDRGGHSLTEILSQPQCWGTCLGELQQSQSVKEAVGRFGRAAEWLFIGCGSSYYVALAAAATMKSLTGRRARAVPASEILLYPELVFSGDPCIPVLISRSGQTSEVLKAAEVLKQRNLASMAVSCVKGKHLKSWPRPPLCFRRMNKARS